MATSGTHYPQIYYEDMYITEPQKAELDYLKGNIDHWVSSLVQSKAYIKTYRDYYNGVRDNKDFEYLTENFGIGSPSTLKFTNIIKPRIDSIVAQIESDAYTYTITATDDKTIDLIAEEKKKKKLDDILNELKKFTIEMDTKLKNGEDPVPYSELKENLDNIKEKYKNNFISDFEIAAQRVCSYFEKSNEMELRRKLATLVHDLAVTGECYYRVYYERLGSDPVIEVIKPENFFHNKNTNTPFLEGTDAVVHREYMTHKQVAAKYGKFMTKDQMKELFGGRYMTRTARSLNSGLDLELYYGDEDPMLGQKYFNSAYTVEVMHVEWLATNEITIDEEEMRRLTQIGKGHNYKIGEKVRRLDRYEGTRIGGTVYVNAGKTEHVPRSVNDPYTCGFSYGGLLNNDRGGKPYSIVGALKDLQDIYDLTMFYRDNILANSGVKGDRINIAGIPKVLGNDFMSRLMKYIALKKIGFELIDPTEQGAQLFTQYGSFDNSPDGNSLQAINFVLNQIEHQADIIAGTNPQMLGNIEERDAVENVRRGIKQSLMINHSLFELFRANQNRLMTDLIKMAQITYKEGKRLAYIAGSTSYTFKILPEKFSFTDYAISISYASKDSVKVESMRSLAKELVGAGMLDPDVITKVILSDSVAEISRIVDSGWFRKKSENDKIKQAVQQIQQYEQQLKELQSQLNNVTQQLEAAKTANSRYKESEIKAKKDIELQKLQLEKEKLKVSEAYNDAQIALKQETVQLEREQLYLGVGNSKEIKNL
jgi:hypothetical protein